MMETRITKQNLLSDIDAGIKLILAVLFSFIPFFCEKTESFIILSMVLGLLTFFAGMNRRTLSGSIFSYSVIVIFPYFFGFMISRLFAGYSVDIAFVYRQGLGEMALKIFKLFVFWYTGTLYLHTTPLKSLFGMLDKCLLPFKKLGLPISDYLKIIMYILATLPETISKAKNKFHEKKASLSGDDKSFFKINIRGIAYLIVSIIISTFQNLEKIQEDMEEMDEKKDLYSYELKITKLEIIAAGCFLLLSLGLYTLEIGYWV